MAIAMTAALEAARSRNYLAGEFSGKND